MKHLLIDAKNCLYRHNYTSNLTLPSGQKISGVFGMLKDVTNLIRDYDPDNVVIVWDKGKCRKRLEIYPEYKANRANKDPAVLENIRFQVHTARELFSLLPVKQLLHQDTEADDIIGFLTKKLSGEKIIASNDTDFIQLISEDTKLVSSRKSVVKELTLENINEELGFDKKYYVLHKALIGDSSDNIKGVQGIGKVTATKIVNKQIEKPIDKEILKRNMDLIRIGKFLDKEEITAIAEMYRKEKEKTINTMRLKARLGALRFNSILSMFDAVMEPYKNLYMKQRDRK